MQLRDKQLLPSRWCSYKRIMNLWKDVMDRKVKFTKSIWWNVSTLNSISDNAGIFLPYLGYSSHYQQEEA